MARNVKVEFIPADLVIDDDRDTRIADVLVRRYQDELPVLAAGAQLKNIYFRRDWKHKDAVRNAHPVPQQIEVQISYMDAEKRNSYSERFPIDVDILMHETHSRPSSSNDTPRRVANAVEAVARGIGSA